MTTHRAACPLCSRIAAGLGRPTCPLCAGAAAITLGPLAITAGEPDGPMAAAVAIAIRRGVDDVIAQLDADPTLDAPTALAELAAGLRSDGYLAPVAWDEPGANPAADLRAVARRARDHPAATGIVVNIDHRHDPHATGYAAGVADGLNRRPRR